MEICSRTLQFFFCLFSLHDLLSNPPLVCDHDTCPGDLQTRVCTLRGCRCAAVHSAAPQIAVFLGNECVEERKQTSETSQTQTGWLSRLCGRWSQTKWKDKTSTALRNSTRQWEDVLSVALRRYYWLTDVLPRWHHLVLLVFLLSATFRFRLSPEIKGLCEF